MSIQKENIEIICHTSNYELEDNKTEINIDDLLYGVENTFNKNITVFNEIQYRNIEIKYYKTLTLKELLLICEYYGFAKNLKSNKLNKDEIIQVLIDFENNNNNYQIVKKRENLWFYINELKDDKFMKKYVFW